MHRCAFLTDSLDQLARKYLVELPIVNAKPPFLRWHVTVRSKQGGRGRNVDFGWRIGKPDVSVEQLLAIRGKGNAIEVLAT